jgi:hypothetical protein
MTAGWFQGRQLQCNDTVSYRYVNIVPHNPTTLQQPASEGSSSVKVVDFTDDGMVGVLMDGGATHRSWTLLESDTLRMWVKEPGPSLSFHTSASSFLSVRQPKLTSSANRRGGMELHVSLLLTHLFLSGAGGGFRHPAPQGGDAPRF